jgi:hypothetical protein
MSGSGGGGGGSGGGVSDVPCERLLFTTHLTSLDPDVAETVHQGELLEVALRTPTGTTIIARTNAGEILGAITSGSHAQLLTCLRAGVSFRARVVSIQGGDCEVEVRPSA